LWLLPNFFASRTNGLKDVYVIFDNISSTHEKILENGTNFFIKSARPNFSTTDDMLVDWSEQNKNFAPNSLHVTSDRALCGRLNIEGAKVMKPKSFFNLTLKLTNQESETVDSWFSKVENNLVK
jgi:F0F1-type ATP synthase gamma subunit